MESMRQNGIYEKSYVRLFMPKIRGVIILRAALSSFRRWPLFTADASRSEFSHTRLVISYWMAPLVTDPLNPSANFDYIDKRVHANLNENYENFNSLFSYHIKTNIPLSNCEPLIGMSSVTNPDWTAFTLSLASHPFRADLTKFSNSCSSISLNGDLFKNLRIID